MNKFLIVNKDKNYTSRDIVNIVSKVLNTKKVGHFGTLDPLAKGVLVLGIGKYTKFCDVNLFNEKEYIAEVVMGIKTDTYDITGKVLDRNDKIIPKDELIKLLNTFTKTYYQEVPIYSSVKVNGKKLYQYARENKEVILPKKEVTIYKNELLSYDNNKFTFKTIVSKGTYIRSLINDLANYSSYLFTMSNLERIRQGKFTIYNSYTIDDIKNGNYKFLDIEDVLDYDVVLLTKENEKDILNGKYIDNIYNKDFVLFKNSTNKVLYKSCNNNKMKPFIFY